MPFAREFVQVERESQDARDDDGAADALDGHRPVLDPEQENRETDQHPDGDGVGCVGLCVCHVHTPVVFA